MWATGALIVGMTDHKHLTELERLAIRERPDGQPLMHQKWGKLLFMHWRIEEAELRPLIPEQLEIDTFDGSAWIGFSRPCSSNSSAMSRLATVSMSRRTRSAVTDRSSA